MRIPCFLTLITLFSHCGSLDLRPPPSPKPILSQVRPAGGGFKLIIIDVGQGDAALLVTPMGRGILIDCGPEEAVSKVRSVLEEEGLSSLEAIFVSHFHADHMGACGPLIAGRDGLFETPDDLPVAEGLWDRGDDPFPRSIEFPSYQKGLRPFRKTMQAGDTWEWD